MKGEGYQRDAYKQRRRWACVYSCTDVQMRAVDCHLPMTNVYRDRLEKGLEVLYWGLEWRLRRFIDVYMPDKRKDSPKGESPC